MELFSDIDGMAKFLTERGFEIEFYSKWGHSILELGGLVFENGSGIPIIKKLYSIVCKDLIGETRKIPSPFDFTEASHSELTDLEEFEEDITYLNDIGFWISITDNPFLLKLLRPNPFPRMRFPVFVNMPEWNWSDILEYERAKAFVRELSAQLAATVGSFFQ